MASRNTDVNLIVRARTEGEKAIAGLGSTLDALFDDARRGTTDIADLGKTIGLLDKAAAAIAGSMDKAGSAVDRQRAKIAESNAEYAALLRQQAEAQRILEGFGNQGDKAFVGPRTKAFTEQYQGVRAEVERLGAAISNTFTRITQQSAQLNGTQSALLNLAANSTAVAQGQAEAEAQIELTNQALREQAAAGERVTDIQRRINDLTGVNRPSANGSAAAAASVLVEADEIYRRAEARETEIRKLREQEVALADVADAERAEDANRDRFNITDDPRGSQARASAAAFIEAAEAEERMAREAVQLRAQLDPLAAIQDRANASLARFRELASAGKISAEELGRAEQHLASQAEQARVALERSGRAGAGGKVAVFGLQPYELTNLGYQINDIATQLLSGTSLTQTLGQQGGQILQIFPRVTSAIVGAFTNPAFLGAAAVLGGIIIALKEAGDQAERLREFGAALAFRSDGGTYDATALANEAATLDRLGASAKDADAAINALFDQGVAADAIGELGRAAQETADRLGQSLPDAAKAAAEAFTGGFEAVAAFDDKLRFLTASEREHIRALFDSGNAEAARTEARLAYQRMEEGIAVKSRGAWGEAARSLGTAWDALIKFIANSAPIKITIGVLSELARAVKGVGDAISSALGNEKSVVDGVAARIGQVQARIRDLQKTVADYEEAIAKKSPIAGTLKRIIDVAKRQLAEAQAELTSLERVAPDTLSGNPNGVQAKRRAERLSEIDAEQQLQKLRQGGQAGLNKADSQRRAQLAGEAAYRAEMLATGDAIVAGRLREAAITKEQGEIEKQNEAARDAARAKREREIRQFESRVVGAEGGTGKNPHSSAKGYGQFTESTFLDQFKKVFPEQVSLPREQILALRQNEQVSRAIIDNYARENARFLESFGAKVTAGNLYLAHFLGGAGAKAVLQAPGDKPVDQILRRFSNSAKVLSGNQGYLRTEGGKGRYRTASELQAFIANRVGDTGVAQTQGQVEINNLLEDAKRRQDEFNQGLRHANEDRQRGIDAMRAEAGLRDTALIAEQRRQAVLQAELDLRQKVEDANKNLKPGETAVVISDDQIAKAKDLAGALFDVQHAREALSARLDEVERPLDSLQDQVQLLTEQRDLLRSMGEFSAADEVGRQLDDLSGEIGDAYDKLIEFYEALTPEERVQLGIDDTQLDVLIAKLERAKQAQQVLNGSFLDGAVTYRGFVDAFASSATDAFFNFFQRVDDGQNVFKSFGKAIQQFAASFALALAQMIIKMLAFTAALYALSAITHIPVQVLAAGAALGASVHHAGGIAGSAGGVKRQVNPAVFAAAVRYHNGGIAGFAADEVPAILKRNEEVLTEGDPRHRANGGLNQGGGESSLNAKIVNLFDSESLAQHLLSTKAGEKVILNFIKANSRAVKAAIA